jgi:hypothetical protein
VPGGAPRRPAAPEPESMEVTREARADHEADHLCCDQRSWPNVQDCYRCANRCLDMWNGSGDPAALSDLLRMADAWLQLAAELANAA